jgi:N-acetylglucosaminyldiphosphoundecaprenol N-acetyl-beta-D-mannosaminyltransferase
MNKNTQTYRRVNILGCPFDAISFPETENYIRNAISHNLCVQLVPGSIDFVVKAKRNPSFAAILWDSDIVFADGVPIVWAAALLKDPIKGRVSGTDIVYSCAQIGAELGCAVALVGGQPQHTFKAAEGLKKIFPASKIYPLETPFPLNEDASNNLVATIKNINAKIVLVALGAPKQERWINKYLSLSGANVGIGIGSAFDIISGHKPRAPKVLKDNGFEWLWRVFQEPKRLARRYFIEDSPFFLFLASEIISRKFRNREVVNE